MNALLNTHMQHHACMHCMHAMQHKQECLEDNMDAPDFSAGCRKDLEDALAKRVGDFRCDGGCLTRGFLNAVARFCLCWPLVYPNRFANPCVPLKNNNNANNQTKH